MPKLRVVKSGGSFHGDEDVLKVVDVDVIFDTSRNAKVLVLPNGAKPPIDKETSKAVEHVYVSYAERLISDSNNTWVLEGDLQKIIEQDAISVDTLVESMTDEQRKELQKKLTSMKPKRRRKIKDVDPTTTTDAPSDDTPPSEDDAPTTDG